MLNKDLYEKYLQKKAKKLGVSVEELRGGNSAQSTPTPSVQTYSTPQPEQVVSPTPVVQSQIEPQPVVENPVYEAPKSEPVVDRRENKFAIIGYPLGHSLSEVIHKAGFKSIGLDGSYEILETDPEDLVNQIKNLKNGNYKGFNVTIPLKLPVALFVDEVDRFADIASAINTVVINPDRTLKGYNTDVIGFKKAIPSDFALSGKVAGVLGTGGASRAATVALAEAGVKEIRFYTRNIPNTIKLLNYMRRMFPNVQFDAYQIENIRDLSMIDILVNATPIGMLGYSADMTPVEKYQMETLPQGALVYDVIYNPKKTIFLKIAEDLGYRTVNGVDMLIGQAVAAEEIWTGKTPSVDAMKIALLEALE